MNKADTQLKAVSENIIRLEKKVTVLSAQIEKLFGIINVDNSGNVVLNSDKKLKLQCASSFSLKSASSIDITADGTVKVKGVKIDLN
jgi:hypothetical protein